jgi:hypothetical protein
VVRQLRDIVEDKLVRIAEGKKVRFGRVGEHSSNKLDAILLVLKIRWSTEVLSQLGVLIFFCHERL